MIILLLPAAPARPCGALLFRRPRTDRSPFESKRPGRRSAEATPDHHNGRLNDVLR